MVLSLRFPDYIAFAPLRELYGSPYLRAAIHLTLVTSFLLGTVSAFLRANKVLALTGIGFTLVASVLGGSRLAVGGVSESTHAWLAVDFFVLNLLLYPAVFVPLERLFALRSTQPVFRRHWLVGLSYFFVNSLLVEVLTVLTLSPALVLFAWARVNALVTQMEALPLLVQAVSMILVADLTQYWVHRTFHVVPFLWPFHAIHHSVEEMDWLAGSRLHLVDVILTRGLAPNSRFNVWANQEEFPGLGTALASTAVSAVVEVLSGPPIIAERAMYLNAHGQTFSAGHESAGVNAPALTWFLAEGATGTYFDEFVLIANPSPDDALVEASFLLPSGTVYTKQYVIGANSRFNIWVDEEDIPGFGKSLADTAVSTTVTSLNDVPVVVERAMWWPGSSLTWHEGDNSAGATTTGTRWALAEGEHGGPYNAQTYILIANTSTEAAAVQVRLPLKGLTSRAPLACQPGAASMWTPGRSSRVRRASGSACWWRVSGRLRRRSSSSERCTRMPRGCAGPPGAMLRALFSRRRTQARLSRRMPVSLRRPAMRTAARSARAPSVRQ